MKHPRYTVLQLTVCDDHKIKSDQS
jgi:hypothetical protein